MPNYRVWYRDVEEPLEFSTAYRCSEAEILDHIVAHEQITPLVTPAATEAPAATSLRQRIAENHLAPVRYTEDESEINIIQ